jgi:hypothetical protein
MRDDFHHRSQYAEAFADAAATILRSATGLIHFVGRSGVEFSDLAASLSKLRQLGDPMARRLRFNPDGALISSQIGMAHWEAKASSKMERAPFEQYMRYEIAGEPVIMVIAPDLLRPPFVWRPVLVGRLSGIVLRDGRETIESVEPQYRYPVIDGWVTPRASPRGVMRGSGTPYREMDLRRSKVLKIADALMTDDVFVQIRPDFLAGDTMARASGFRPIRDIIKPIVERATNHHTRDEHA